jgi:hypothetical protein
MKESAKGFRNNFRTFRAILKNVPCDDKLPLIWELVEECMNKSDKNVEFVRDRWWQFTGLKIKSFDEKFGLNKLN